MPEIKIKDIKIYYETHGDGFPIVMIMGLAANSDWWGPEIIENLSKRFKVVIFDNRGVARSENNNKDFSIKDLADDTIGLMDALNIQKAYILGISMGGMIAQELILNYPERVERLILCSTTCGGTQYVPPSQEVLGSLAKGRQGFTPEEFTRATSRLLYTDDFRTNNPDKVEEDVQVRLKHPISENVYQRQIKAVLGFKTARKLKNIKHPTLIMHGKKDILIPYQNGVNISKLISGSQLFLFENSAHALFSEEFNKVFSTLNAFLNK